MTEADLALLHRQMTDSLAGFGAEWTPYTTVPRVGRRCSCRKPLPGMLFQAQRDFHLGPYQDTGCGG